MPCLRSVGIFMSSFMLSLHLFFVRPLLRFQQYYCHSQAEITKLKKVISSIIAFSYDENHTFIQMFNNVFAIPGCLGRSCSEPWVWDKGTASSPTTPKQRNQRLEYLTFSTACLRSMRSPPRVSNQLVTFISRALFVNFKGYVLWDIV